LANRKGQKILNQESQATKGIQGGGIGASREFKVIGDGPLSNLKGEGGG